MVTKVHWFNAWQGCEKCTIICSDQVVSLLALHHNVTGSVGTDADCISGMEQDQSLGTNLREKRGLLEGYVIGPHVSYVHVPRVALDVSPWRWVRQADARGRFQKFDHLPAGALRNSRSMRGR
jgi:hypothetical protein